MQSTKLTLVLKKSMSSTHMLDQVYGLTKISPFDGEASKSKQDIEEKLVLD